MYLDLPVFALCMGSVSSFPVSRPARSLRSLGRPFFRTVSLCPCASNAELLLKADEAVAILSDQNAENGAAGGGDLSSLGRSVALTPDEESRREAEALAVLLSRDRSPVAGAVAAAKRNERLASIVRAGAAGSRTTGEESGTEAAAVARAAAGVKEECVQAEGQEEATAGQKAAESALTRLAARYLVRETVRGKIPDPVANFHVRRARWCTPAPRGGRFLRLV